MCAVSARLAGLSLRNNGHLAESGDAIGKRRVGTEKRPERAAAKKGLHDAQGGSRRRQGGRGDAIVVRPQFLKGTDQTVRVSDHACAGLVGGLLPLAGQSLLQ